MSSRAEAVRWVTKGITPGNVPVTNGACEFRGCNARFRSYNLNALRQEHASSRDAQAGMPRGIIEPDS
jgi:hypothetical protein